MLPANLFGVCDSLRPCTFPAANRAMSEEGDLVQMCGWVGWGCQITEEIKIAYREDAAGSAHTQAESNRFI